jgi:hypothetical protein
LWDWKWINKMVPEMVNTFYPQFSSCTHACTRIFFANPTMYTLHPVIVLKAHGTENCNILDHFVLCNTYRCIAWNANSVLCFICSKMKLYKCMMPLLLQHDAWWRPQCEPCPYCLQPNHQSAYLSLIHWHHKDTNQQLTNASTHFTPANFMQTHQIVSNPMKASPKQLPSTK